MDYERNYLKFKEPIRPVRCYKCGKVLRWYNKSGLCYFHMHAECLKKRNENLKVK